MSTLSFCLECGRPITRGVYNFSTECYGHPLCIGHQSFITESGTSPQAVDLYFALKNRQLPVAFEYYDGHKHVDIAIPGKLYIEVNGAYHYNTMQAYTDLSRSLYSLKENIVTISIPNYLLDDARTFHMAVEELTKACHFLLAKSSFWELAHTLSPIQKQ